LKDILWYDRWKTIKDVIYDIICILLRLERKVQAAPAAVRRKTKQKMTGLLLSIRLVKINE